MTGRLSAIAAEDGLALPGPGTPAQFVETEAMYDPISEEIRQIREGHAARFNCDLDAIHEDCKKSEDRILS